MPSVGISDIGRLWIAVGGTLDTVVNATAVALAESGGHTDAYASNPGSYDAGLWQINSVHIGQYGLTEANIYDPVVNARAALAISSNGQNWGPWATAYTDIAVSGWLPWLPYLQPGSAAAARIVQVNEAFAASGLISGPALTPGCTATSIGIPNQAVAGLAVGASVDTMTCPGGSFPASDLGDGLQVCWNQGGAVVCVTNADSGSRVPGGINVSVRRYAAGSLPGAPTPSPSPAPSPQPSPGIPGCTATSVGIPYAAVSGLQVGQAVTTLTCPYGPFDAGDLAPGLRVVGLKGIAPFSVSSLDRGFMVPGGIVVTVIRFAAASPATPTPSPSPVPPVAPFPTSPAPSGTGAVQIQQGWAQHERNLNLYYPDVIERLLNARTKLQGG